MSQCPSFIRARNSWKQLRPGTSQYNNALNNLKAKICNSRAKTVCCPRIGQWAHGPDKNGQENISDII